jgi:hypothetical protein
MLTTEITNFGGLRCVAGWDMDRQRMIRPEPRPGGFWPAGRIAPNGPFEIGKAVQFEAVGPNPATDYPHLTEDRVVSGKIAAGPQVSNKDFEKVLRGSAFSSLSDLFDGKLILDGDKAYVPRGTACRSLGGLKVDAKGVVIETYTNFSGKLRLRIKFTDAVGALAPNVTSTRAYELHSAGQIDALNAKISKASSLMLRIGLARAFAQMPDRCYLQVNELRTMA